jgi:hypothetical protein
MRKLVRWLATYNLAAILLAALLLVSPPLQQAQQMTADVLGTVTDPSGAALSGATVTFRNLDTGETRKTVTGSHGDYTFNQLAIGHCSLKVEAKGFKSFQVQEFQIAVGNRVRFDAKLEVGAVSESVEVSAEQAAALQTEESSVGSTLNESEVQDLPLNGRNYMGMVVLAPGVTGGTSNGNWTYTGGSRPDDRRTGDTISVNGKSDELNNHEVDGFDNNERAMGNIGLRPSMDGIEEVKIDTSSYSAESGRTAGAITNVITKSGTNAYHGSLYEYLRNDIFDATNYFAISHTKLRLNQFGGSIGGPVKKDKTFFFFDIEEDRQIQALTYVTTIPTLFEEQNPGNFSDLLQCPPGPPGPCTPSVPGPIFTPVGTIAPRYWSLFPSPSPGMTTLVADNYVASPSEMQNSTTIDARLDHRFTSKDLFFARYALNPVKTEYPGPFPYNSALGVYPNGNLTAGPSNQKATSQQLQLTYTHLFNDHMIGDLKAGYSRINIVDLPLNYGKNADAAMGFPAETYSIPGLPMTNTMASIATGNQSDNAMLGDAVSTPIWDKGNNYQYLGSVTYTKGVHNFKFGGGVIRVQLNYNQTGQPAGQFMLSSSPPYGNMWMNMLADAPIGVNRVVEMVNPLYESWEPSFYALDNWRVSPSFTLNIGLRYEIFTPYTEAHNQYSNFDLSTLSFVMGTQSPTLGVKTDHKDFSPRIGFAKTFGPKTVLRGAFGMTYFPVDTGFLPGGANFVQNENPPYYFSSGTNPASGFCTTFEGATASEPTCELSFGPFAHQSLPNVGIPIPSLVPISTALSNPNVTKLSTLDPNLRPSYLEQWNLSVQREFGANTFTVAYVGDVGRQLMRNVNAMNPSTPPGSAIIPSYVYSTAQVGNYVNTINRVYNGNSEQYNAMQLIFSRQAAKGLTVGANYVWSHGLGTDTAGYSNTTAGILPGNPSYDYGNQDLDVRQRISFHATYTLPFAASANGVLAQFVKGWQFNALGYWQTGMPFTVVDSVQDMSTGNCTIDVPNCPMDRPNQLVSTKLSNPRVNEWFNINAFQVQSIGTAGNEGVNQVEGPRDRKLDISLNKDFTLLESLKLQFRAEAFNITNTPNFAPPGNSVWGWNSEGLVDMTNSENGSFGKITSTSIGENPRQFQFALKLLF